jgi:hypothetical protein
MLSHAAARRAADGVTQHRQGFGPRRIRDTGRDETGAVLILALVLLLVVTAIVGGLIGWVGNDLNNATHFASDRQTQEAATSVTDTAIQNIRYAPLWTQTLNASPPAACWGSGGVSELSNPGEPEFSVWCSTAWNPSSSATRVVTFSACPVDPNESGESDAVMAQNCAAQPYLQAVVTFDDYPAGLSAPTTGECYVYCGTTMTVDSWVWSPLVPAVTGLTLPNGSAAAGPIAGGTTVVLTGTGFVPGATVTFVEESGGAPSSDNVLLPATGVTVNSPTSITAVSPGVTEGTQYFVTVTTPNGTSAYGPVFTYSLINPTVGSLSPSSGPSAGGTAVTITGTGFVEGATVNFVDQSSGDALPASYVTVLSDSEITAVSPAVTQGSQYWVTVTTPTNTSADSAAFTYRQVVPTVATVSPATGSAAGGTTVTITGTSFFSGATVSFVEESAGAPTSPKVSFPATSVTVTSSTTMTVVTPAVTVATTYFVLVTTPSGGTSGYGAYFTYTAAPGNGNGH